MRADGRRPRPRAARPLAEIGAVPAAGRRMGGRRDRRAPARRLPRRCPVPRRLPRRHGRRERTRRAPGGGPTRPGHRPAAQDPRGRPPGGGRRRGPLLCPRPGRPRAPARPLLPGAGQRAGGGWRRGSARCGERRATAAAVDDRGRHADRGGAGGGLPRARGPSGSRPAHLLAVGAGLPATGAAQAPPSRGARRSAWLLPLRRRRSGVPRSTTRSGPITRPRASPGDARPAIWRTCSPIGGPECRRTASTSGSPG